LHPRLPHDVPFVFREPQDWVSAGADVDWHVPLLQTIPMQLRDCEPLLLQVPA
jgi:hypothetical protein